MKSKKRDSLIRIGLLIAATVLLMLLLPHSDTQRYNYELNQPWRYPLLMADFDMEVKRDSISAQQMRDSIDRSYVPIVRRLPEVADRSVESFRSEIADKTPPAATEALTRLLRRIYVYGVVDASVYQQIHQGPTQDLRVSNHENGASSLTTIDGSSMLSPARAFEFMDSAYRADGAPPIEEHNDEIAKALQSALVPDIVIDTLADSKYRSQEYLAADASIGVIKKGQRIVDRGEIITPQIYTNLNNYMQKMEELHTGDNNVTYFYIGQTLYILICFIGLYVFMYLYRSTFYNSTRKMTFLVAFITLFTLFAILMSEFFANGIYLVPFAAVPVVLIVFFDARTGIFALLTTIILSCLVALYPYQFIFMELFAGLAAAFSIRTLTRRSQLLRTAFITLFAYIIAYTITKILTDGNLLGFEWRMIGIFTINAVVLSFVYILIFVVEKIFGFTSQVTLVELSDINSPLLRRLAEEAPGTFQHSVQVSTLASEAARAIGANTQLVRTGALYHDIGKLDSPIFFTENQHGINPHSGLNPETSAQKIISHVTKGIEYAQKNKLPLVIRQFIPEHHGKSLARYFYNTAVNSNPDKEIDKSRFMYPGPNPQSRETAILMLADSVEAASRSLQDFSPESISNLVDKIVDDKVKEGLLNDSPLSFRDVQTIKDSFKKRLATIYHSRVSYPELKKQEK